MPEPVRAVLEAAMAQVLETMFFAAESGEPAVWPAPGDCVAASVAFSGTRSGTLAIRLTGGGARARAASFLGVESGGALAPGQVEEVVCELANMVCGAALTRLDPAADVKLAPPAPSDPRTPSPPGAVEAVIVVDDGPMAVTLAFHP